MLRELPYQTIGDIARHGLELHVYCSRCFATRRLDLRRAWLCMTGRLQRPVPMPALRHPWTAEDPAGRTAAGRRPRHTRLPVVQLMLWEIDQAQLDTPPWSGSRQHYRCPGCGGRVEWHIHGPAWRPGYGCCCILGADEAAQY